MRILVNIVAWILFAPIILFIAFGLLLMLMMFATFIITAPFSKGEFEEEYSHQFEIYSLKDNQAHIISRYSADSQQRYYFIRDMDGGLKSGFVKASNSVIVESDEKPRIEVYRTYPKYSKWIVKIVFENGFMTDDAGYPKNYRIYIPKGSVTNEFNIDNE